MHSTQQVWLGQHYSFDLEAEKGHSLSARMTGQLIEPRGEDAGQLCLASKDRERAGPTDEVEEDSIAVLSLCVGCKVHLPLPELLQQLLQPKHCQSRDSAASSPQRQMMQLL